VSEGEPTIAWPEGHEPEGAAWHAVNDLQVGAAVEDVFAWLRRPDLWSSYYWNARLVRHRDGPWPEVALGSRWRWLTFGVLIASELVQLDDPRPGGDARLAWSAGHPGAHGHHAWVLSPRDGGTRIRTEETQRGLAARIAAPLMSRLQVRIHQQWLEGLGKVAAGGPPPPLN
jgi:hypothetical protein